MPQLQDPTRISKNYPPSATSLQGPTAGGGVVDSLTLPDTASSGGGVGELQALLNKYSEYLASPNEASLLNGGISIGNALLGGALNLIGGGLSYLGFESASGLGSKLFGSRPNRNRATEIFIELQKTRQADKLLDSQIKRQKKLDADAEEAKRVAKKAEDYRRAQEKKAAAALIETREDEQAHEREMEEMRLTAERRANDAKAESEARARGEKVADQQDKAQLDISKVLLEHELGQETQAAKDEKEGAKIADTQLATNQSMGTHLNEFMRGKTGGDFFTGEVGGGFGFNDIPIGNPKIRMDDEGTFDNAALEEMDKFAYEYVRKQMGANVALDDITTNVRELGSTVPLALEAFGEAEVEKASGADKEKVRQSVGVFKQRWNAAFDKVATGLPNIAFQVDAAERTGKGLRQLAALTGELAPESGLTEILNKAIAETNQAMPDLQKIIAPISKAAKDSPQLQTIMQSLADYRGGTADSADEAVLRKFGLAGPVKQHFSAPRGGKDPYQGPTTSDRLPTTYSLSDLGQQIPDELVKQLLGNR